jgi:ABC-type branched-subunit amino acid transport system substrate-binding protein
VELNHIIRGGENRMRKLVMVLVVIGLVVAGFACNGGPTVTDKILVGVPAPTTGIYSGFGKGGVWGMEAAVDDINALGGVDVGGVKHEIELVIVNTESDEAKAGTLAESLIVEDGVNFLAYGDQPPPMNIPIALKAEEHKVPYICTTGPAEPWLGARADAGGWSYTWATGLFAIVDPGDRPADGYTIADTWLAMLDLCGDELTNKNAGVFACDDPDGVGWYGLFPGVLEDWGCTVYEPTGGSLLPPDTSDFSDLVDCWVTNNVKIVWGNAIAPFVGKLLEDCETAGFAPELISIGRAPLFYEDVSAWEGRQVGVLVEIWWDPAWGDSPGIGTTTPESLAARYLADTDVDAEAVNRNIGAGYSVIQVLVDAIERAGTLDADDVCAALADTDLDTIRHHVAFDEAQFSRGPLVYGQWQWDEQEEDWVCPIVLSKHNFIETTGEPICPLPEWP